MFMGLINRVLVNLQENGLFSTVKTVYLSYLRPQLKYLFIRLRRNVPKHQPVIKLSICDTSAQFVAYDDTVVKRTRKRFQEEQYELKSIMDELKEDDVFYDIGANTGLYTCFVSNKSNQCQVVAFEPYPPNLIELRDNTELNNSEQISIFDIALSDRSGTTSFSVPSAPNFGYGSGSITGENSGISVDTRQGDELITNDKVRPPNIVKIDVEGAEPLVVDGLRNALGDERCRLVFCELHPPDLSKFDYSTFDIVAEFEQMGYDVKLHERWNNAHVIEARRE